MKKRYVMFMLLILGVWGYFRIGMTQIDYMIAHIAYPGMYVMRYITDAGKKLLQHRRSLDELGAALAESQEQIARLTEEVIALRSTHIYLDELREVRAFRYRYSTDWMLSAQVVGRIISPQAHIIMLDRGVRHGVVRDMVAVYHNGIVGRVTEVYPWWCKVTLMTDRLSKIPAVCSATKTTGIFEGVNELGIGTLSYVSHLLPLEDGDLVITSGDGLVYPRGFAIGHIASIRQDSDKLQYHVTIKPLFNPYELRMCYLIARGAEYDATQPLIEDQDTVRITDAI
jgi:rod shape-determining protein MreC